MIDKLVLEALQKRTTAAIAASTKTDLKAKYVGLEFTPEADKPWLEIVYIPNNIIGEFWDSGKTYRGLFRLILHWPLDKKGIYPAMELSSSIAASFEKGTALVNGEAIVRITEHPDMANVLEQQTETLCVLSLRYSCFKA